MKNNFSKVLTRCLVTLNKTLKNKKQIFKLQNSIGNKFNSYYI